MKIYEQYRMMDISILEYQYQDKKPDATSFDYDANWLNVQVRYREKDVDDTYVDACLMTTELQDIREGLEQIIAGTASNYISDFLEPYLKICIAKADNRIVFAVTFVYDTTDGYWKDRRATAVWSEEEALAVLKEIKSAEQAFATR